MRPHRTFARGASGRGASDDRGSLSAFVVCVAMSVVCLAGLAHDGGRVVAIYAESSDVAAAAARMGDQFVVGIREGRPRIDANAGRRAVLTYLHSRGMTGDVEISGRTVTVRVTRSVPMTVLSLFGVGHRAVSVTRSAELVAG